MVFGGGPRGFREPLDLRLLGKCVAGFGPPGGVVE